jgi:hypothetical protein
MSCIGHLTVSNIRHLRLHYPLLETKRHRMVIVNIPDSFCGISSAASLFDTTLQFGFLKFNLQFDNLRFSSGDQPDASTAPLLIIATASTDQLVAVMFEELLCAFLTKRQC